MKPRLIPVYFDPGRDQDFDKQLSALTELLADDAELAKATPLGATLPDGDAVVVPQLLGEAYRRVDDFKRIDLPILIVTSTFGTLSMWDWEIIDYLRAEGVETIAPYTLQQAREICRALRVRRELAGAKFLAYQDDPGEGAQASIFKRFYWWEDECAQRMFERFGITIVKQSFQELGKRASEIPDRDAAEVWTTWQLPTEGLSDKSLYSAVKLYLAVRRDLEQDKRIRGAGINCLNESHFSDTTPCLAWSMLYEERGLIWGCEADTVSMLTKYILHRSLGTPILMTNLYPFLLGQAALKHEGIKAFPQVDARPEDHILVAHCGYMGVIPKSFCTEWTLRSKVLDIVDDNATAIDARIPEGDITLAKLHATFDRMTVAQGTLKGYAQYPGSHCLNGGVIQVGDGHKLMSRLASHHYLLLTGHKLVNIRMISPIFGLAIEAI
jgi:hypothetical protein